MLSPMRRVVLPSQVSLLPVGPGADLARFITVEDFHLPHIDKARANKSFRHLRNSAPG